MSGQSSIEFPIRKQPKLEQKKKEFQPKAWNAVHSAYVVGNITRLLEWCSGWTHLSETINSELRENLPNTPERTYSPRMVKNLVKEVQPDFDYVRRPKEQKEARGPKRRNNGKSIIKLSGRVYKQINQSSKDIADLKSTTTALTEIIDDLNKRVVALTEISSELNLRLLKHRDRLNEIEIKIETN